jgi:KipI family sensor histidine kinase inhibitor
VTAYDEPRFLAAGDGALVVELGDAIDPAINEAVLGLDAALASANVPGVLETVPTYRSLLVEYDPRVTDRDRLVEVLRALRHSSAALPVPRRFRIPVAFGGAYGEDLAEVADRVGMAPDEAVTAFTAAEYRVYMVGFAPGFSYLGPLPAPLHLPRRASPRLKVPAGTVGIGGIQAAVYSVPIPSGWHLLGRTPARAFDKRLAEPFLFRTGDLIRFTAIEPDAFAVLEEKAEAGAWRPEPS